MLRFLSVLTVLAAVSHPLLASAATSDPSPADPTKASVVFASFDAGRSVFGTLGMKRAIFTTLEESGWVGLGSFGAGRDVSRDRRNGTQEDEVAQGNALIGYQWMTGNGVVAIFLGPEVEARARNGGLRNLSSDDIRVGGRLQGELWLHPAYDTLLTATLIAGTTTPNVWSRTSYGYQWNGVYVGPEAALYAKNNYQDIRIGVHATELKLGPLSLRASAGWRWDTDKKDGAYGTLSAYMKL